MQCCSSLQPLKPQNLFNINPQVRITGLSGVSWQDVKRHCSRIDLGCGQVTFVELHEEDGTAIVCFSDATAAELAAEKLDKSEIYLRGLEFSSIVIRVSLLDQQFTTVTNILQISDFRSTRAPFLHRHHAEPAKRQRRLCSFQGKT